MRYLCTLVLLFVSFNLSFGQVIFSENFDAGSVPADWTIETMASDGGWKVGTPASLSSQFFSIPNNGSIVIATNDDACNCNKSMDHLITPLIDLSGVEKAVLQFDVFYTDDTYAGAQEDAFVSISTDAENWTQLSMLGGEEMWRTEIIDISAYIDQTIQIRFEYKDNQGWLYGMALDNVSVEVPSSLEMGILDLEDKSFGVVGRPFPIVANLFNFGVTEVTELEMSYSVNGSNMVIEGKQNISIAPFEDFEFEFSQDWIPSEEGIFTIDVDLLSVNGLSDEDMSNNSMSFQTEIFGDVEVPNKILELVAAPPEIDVIANSSQQLNQPTDLAFFPVLGKNELWVINQRVESSGGSTVTISNATTDDRDFWHRVDGNAWHFMSLPTGIAFSSDNFNFATTPGVQDANHNNGTFTGPTLWSSDPEIYAQPSGGNGSHLDMLHGSPFSMGIAHEKDNVFWVYDDWNTDIVRYDFVDDHGPGNDDHSDAIVRRYQNIGIKKFDDIPNHMILDKESGWLYFADNGKSRVMRLDINSATNSTFLNLINEQLAEHSSMTGFTVEEVINEGIIRPCGIELFENYLLVGDYETGDIHVYDTEKSFDMVGTITTINHGLTGITVGPDGNIWATNRELNQLLRVAPGEPSSIINNNLLEDLVISPNPTSDFIQISREKSNCNENFSITIFNSLGEIIIQKSNTQLCKKIDVSSLPTGNYFIHLIGNEGVASKSFSVSR